MYCFEPLQIRANGTGVTLRNEIENSGTALRDGRKSAFAQNSEGVVSIPELSPKQS